MQTRGAELERNARATLAQGFERLREERLAACVVGLHECRQAAVEQDPGTHLGKTRGACLLCGTVEKHVSTRLRFRSAIPTHRDCHVAERPRFVLGQS